MGFALYFLSAWHAQVCAEPGTIQAAISQDYIILEEIRPPLGVLELVRSPQGVWELIPNQWTGKLLTENVEESTHIPC